MDVLENRLYALILFSHVYLIHARCPSEPSLVCCPDEAWDDDRAECVGCLIGYSGINCSTPCRFPSYGKNCQSQCSCSATECSPSYGCVRTRTQAINKETTETTQAITTSGHLETTTIIIVTTNQTTSARTSSDVQTASGSTKNAKSTTEVLNRVGAKNLQDIDDTKFMNNPIYLGLFVFSCLFIVLFAVLVGTQIRHKCFKRKHTDRQLRSYDVIDTKQNEGTLCLNSSPKAETPPEQRDPHYIDIENCEENEDRTDYKVPHPSTSNTAVKIGLQTNSPTLDKTIPKYVEIIGSPGTRTESTKEFSVISNSYRCDVTNPKQLY